MEYLFRNSAEETKSETESKTTNDRNLKERGTTEAETNKRGKAGAEVFTMEMIMRFGKY